MDILFQTIVLKFSKTKNLTQKDPLKFQKVKNRYKKSSNKKVLENRPLLTNIGRRERGPKAPRRALGARSPPQELEGGEP